MFAVHVLLAATYDITLTWGVAGYFIEKMDAFEKIGAEGLRRLDFNWEQLPTFVHQQIHFITGLVPPKIEVRAEALVQEILEHFHDDEVLEQLPCDEVSENS